MKQDLSRDKRKPLTLHKQNFDQFANTVEVLQTDWKNLQSKFLAFTTWCIVRQKKRKNSRCLVGRDFSGEKVDQYS